MARPEQFGPIHPTRARAEVWGAEQDLAFGFEVVMVTSRFSGGPTAYRCQLAVPEGDEMVALLLRYREAIAALRGCGKVLEEVYRDWAGDESPDVIQELREKVGKCLAEYRETW